MSHCAKSWPSMREVSESVTLSYLHYRRINLILNFGFPFTITLSMTTPSNGLPDQGSRFVQRWLAAKPEHTQELHALCALPLTELAFASLLQTQLSAGLTLASAMRRCRNLLFSAIAVRDLSGLADLNEVLHTISAFADFVVQTHLAARHAELAAQHGEPIGSESGRPQQMIVIGMGKLGGKELNVSSDIDLIFVYPEEGETRALTAEQRSLSNHEFFIKLGKKIIADIAEITSDGYTFRVDMALRPNGNSGPLAASFSMLETYLMLQGREWERYAWVKARALTGLPEDIQALEAMVQPFVYRRYLDFGAIDALRNMHAQIRAEVIRQETRHPERHINIKLGRGGIREIEFLTQVFQLIRGGREPELRDRSTRITLQVLAQRHLLSAEVVEKLLYAYTFLRNLEHRLQYLDDAQTHVLPRTDEDQTLIAKMAGFTNTAALLNSLTEIRDWVAKQFDAIFIDKNANDTEANLINIFNAPDLNEESLNEYLNSLHFQDSPAATQRLIAMWQSSKFQSLSDPTKNQLQSLLRAALPLVAEISGDTCLVTLNRLLDFFEAIVRRSVYLSLLTEYPHALARVIRMMAASAWAAQYLIRHPVLLDELLDDQTLYTTPDWPQFAIECQRQLNAFTGDTERQMDVLRELHHAQLFRLLAQDLDGILSVEHLADHLSALADTLIEATLSAVWQTITTRHRDIPQFAVIAYGKLGGKELGYASDLDIIFLYDDDDPEAPAQYAKLAQRFITWMTSHTPAGILFDIDIALRPDGASGLLVSSIAAFEKYQQQSAWLWEHQALTRARFCAGYPYLADRFNALREKVLCQPRDANKIKQEILSMRQKMHDAHPNRSTLFDLKHDAGGMIDIEFIVQYLVLQYASTHTSMTKNVGNIALLLMAAEQELIPSTQAHAVADAYRLFRKIQHQIRLRGEDKARTNSEVSLRQSEAVIQLWNCIFSTTE